MPLMQIIKTTAQDAAAEIIAMFISAALLVIVFNLYLGAGLVLYPIALTLAVMAVYLFGKTFRIARFYRRLATAEVSPLDEPAEGIVQERVFEIIGNIHNRHLAEIYRLRSQIETRNALFSQLVHGMKSSVTVIELARESLGAAANAALADIMAENEKLKNSLEQSLNILRLDAFVNDYVPEKIQLAVLVQHSINEHKRDFIYTGIYPKLSGEAMVYTDPKWCGIFISQFISNAIKYSQRDSSVSFKIKHDAGTAQLQIADNGVGIPPEDLPRIFDMFFTGYNGRTRKESTGIGLFMAKHIADRLGIDIDIKSEIGMGTKVTLTFPTLQ